MSALNWEPNAERMMEFVASCSEAFSDHGTPSFPAGEWRRRLKGPMNVGDACKGLSWFEELGIDGFAVREGNVRDEEDLKVEANTIDTEEGNAAKLLDGFGDKT